MSYLDPIPLECVACGKAFARSRFQHEANLRRNRRGPFCSKACGRTGQPPTRRALTEAEFWDRVDRTGDCWEWTGARNSHGYGHFKADRRNVITHRWVYELTNGPIPPGDLEVRHMCHNRVCVRPDHLLLGTPQDNANDRVARHLGGTAAPKAAKLLDEVM
jgi:hypothetical protein